MTRIFISCKQWQLSSMICLLLLSTSSQADKQIIRRLERVTITGYDIFMTARIDTGAENSSLHTTNYIVTQRGKQKWVKFDLSNGKGRVFIISKPIKRFVKIKRKEAKTLQRPAVEMDICLGSVMKRVEVNLVNRSNFDYQLLIGRTCLSKDFIVDVDKVNTLVPDC